MVFRRIAVIGAGTMGRQISLQVARHGFPVALYDTDPAALSQAEATQQEFVANWIDRGQIRADEGPAILERVRYEENLNAAVRDVDLVIEAVPERVELKRTVFAQLDEYCHEHAVIATNSSSIRVSLLEDVTARQEQLANFHFYIPVWDHPMVEVGGGTHTSAATLDALTDFARQIGMLPLRVQRESTGFIFNRVWRSIKKECLKVVDSGVASHEDVDRAWMVMFGTHSPPPFALMDQIGLDVIKDIEDHYARESGDPSDLPPPVLTEKVARGDLGRKTGRGFYTYPDPTWTAPDFLTPKAEG